MSRKLKIVEERAVEQGRIKPPGTGMLHRFAMVGVAVMGASKYPEHIDVRMIAIGLPLCYIFLFVHQFIQVRREEMLMRKG